MSTGWFMPTGPSSCADKPVRRKDPPPARAVKVVSSQDGGRFTTVSGNENGTPERRSDRAGGTVLLAHALLAIGFSLVAAASVTVRSHFDAAGLRGAVLNVLLVQGGFVLFPTFLSVLFHQIQPIRLMGSKSRPGSLILSLLIGIPAAVVFSGLNNLLLFLLNGLGFLPPISRLSAFDLQSFDRHYLELVLIAIVSVLLPAISEELMFRGLILGSLVQRTGEGTALFLQAFVFMLFHNDPAFMLPPFLAGLMLGLIRSRTQSLIPAIIAHISLNTSLALLNVYLPRFSAQFVENAVLSARSLLYASLIATFLAAVALVPLILLIAGNPPESIRHARQRRFPFDWKFGLATLIMIATIGFEYFS